MMEEYPPVELQQLLKAHTHYVTNTDDETPAEQNIITDTVPERLRRWLKLVNN
jgi:hypothetical protein